jgi:hypothetical protein
MILFWVVKIEIMGRIITGAAKRSIMLEFIFRPRTIR